MISLSKTLPSTGRQRSQFSRVKLGVFVWSLAIGLLFLAAPGGAKAQICQHGIAGSMAVFATNCTGNIDFGGMFAHPGDTVAILITASYNDLCGAPPNSLGDRSVITNITVNASAACLTFTSTNLINTNGVPPASIVGGRYPVLSVNPPNADFQNYTPVHITSGVFAGATYLVTIPLNCSGKITFGGNIEAYDTNNINGQNIGGHLGAQPSADIFLLRPAICVGKQCVDGVGENGLITWTGSVTNCGDTPLTNVIVRNFFNNTDEIVLGPTNLDVGQVITFGGSYHPLDPCNPATDTLVAQGTDQLMCTVFGTNSATCRLLFNPAITVSKFCPPAPVPPGGTLVFSGMVSNAGNVTLTNVIVLNNQPTNNTPVFGPVVLLPGETRTFTNSYIVPLTHTNCTISDTLTARGTNICTGLSVTANDTAICPIIHTLTMRCPSNLVVQCLADVPPPDTNAVIATSTAGGVIVTYLGQTIETNGCAFVFTRTYRAVDACTNMQTCMHTITVRDTIPPVLVGVPTNQTYQCLSDVLPLPIVTATDNCDTNVTVTRVCTTNGACPLIITCTWTATDDCTNTSAATRTITVRDTIPPVLVGVPTNRTFQCINEVPAPAAVTAIDNCDTNVIVTRVSSTNGFCPTIIIHCWTGTDDCTNTVTACQTNIVDDTIPPVLVGVPTNQTFQCLADVPVSPTVTGTDNCDTNVQVTRISITNGTCPLIITNIWTAMDDCTNTATESQTIIVRDTIPPVLVGVPTNQTYQCLRDVPAPASVSATDNCDTNVTVTRVSSTNGACPLIIIHCWTATDDCTNTVVACQTNTVDDTIAPTLVGVPTNQTYQCLSDVPPPPNVTAIDNCDTNVLVSRLSITNGTCPLVITNIWTAIDDCTNITTATRTIIVRDTISPVLIGVPTNRTFQCLGDVPPTANVTAIDNCDTNVIVTRVSTTNGLCPIIIVHCWTGTDDCTNTVTACQTNIVNDTVPPVLVGVPANTNYQCLADVPPPANVTATDNCDTNVMLTLLSTTNGACPTIITRRWTAVDDCTNMVSATQTITVRDTIPPVLAGLPTNGLFQCLSDVLPLPTVTATDNCDTNVAITRVSTTNGTCPIFIVHCWTATDDCTNTVTACRTNIVDDTIPPALVGVPTNRTFQCLGDVPPPANVTAIDNCDTNVIVTRVSTTNGLCPIIIVHCWTATDDCTNTVTACRTNIVEDTIPPLLAGLPSNGLFQCLRDVPPLPNVTATDNCDTNVAITRVSTTNGTCPIIIVHCWTATDDCTNTMTACRTNIVNDTIPPVLVGVPAGRTFQCLADVPPPASVSATDNCDTNVGITRVSTTNGLCPIIIVHCWTATDDCTNTATACQTNIINDTTPPTLVGVPPDAAYQCLADVPAPPNVTAMDNCDTNVPVLPTSSISGTCPIVIERCWTAIDDCSNRVQRCQTITVRDTIPPVITCAGDRTIACDAAVVFSPPTASDNCDTNVNIRIVQTVVSTNGLNQAVHCRTWEAADDCTNTARCTQCITVENCPPLICVTKEIACLFPNDSCGPFGKTATGIKGDQDPAFCYRITVSNCGPVALTNVTVLDNQLGDLTTNFFASPLVLFPVNASITRVFSMDWDEDTTNTVTVRGQSAQSGQVTTDFDSAIARIKEARIYCRKLVMSPEDRDTQNRDDLVILPDDGNPYPVTYRVIVGNNGQADLSQVVISDPALLALGCPGVWIINDLRVGQTTNIELCTLLLTCPTPITNNTVTVVGHVDDSGTNGCAYDINGTNITVRSSCEATVMCEVPAACRTTGGGRQDTPLTCPNDDGLRYVTHGGQVGAPVGERTCTIDTSLPNWRLGNPCIHGRWTHVRHLKGGLKGNFHARFFDTLDCACLDTNVGPGGVYGPGTTIGGLCNPGDRPSGPEPRKAPANKIVFTGVGDWADPNGRRAPRACLFRVDLEDRSEPGGSHPHGGKPPADRYRLRIWVLTTSELAALNSGDGLLAFRNAISACNGINVRDGVDIPNSCGPNGVPVFGVRPPDIDDGGELERGNHQIHPSIKNCDPANPTGPGLPNP